MKKKEAYFTVEAALVFPMALGALLVIIFLFLFRYDRCLMEQDMGLLVLYGKNLNVEDEAEAASLLSRKATDIYKDKYVVWEQEKMQITLEKNEICVEGEGKMTFPFPEWNFFNKNNVWRAKSVRRAMRLEPVDFIRIYWRMGGD